MKNLAYWSVGILFTAIFASMPVLSQTAATRSDTGPNENTSNPANGGGTYASGDNGGSPNAGVTPGNTPGKAADTSSSVTNMASHHAPTYTSSSSTLPDNGGVPPAIVSKVPNKATDLGYSSTVPDNGGVPPAVVSKVPNKATDLGYSSTLPGNGGVPPAVVSKVPNKATDLGYSSTVPDNGGAPPPATTAAPSYSSTLPGNGGVPPPATAVRRVEFVPATTSAVPASTNAAAGTGPVATEGMTNAPGAAPTAAAR